MIESLHAGITLKAVDGAWWSVDHAGAAKLDFKLVAFDGKLVASIVVSQLSREELICNWYSLKLRVLE